MLTCSLEDYVKMLTGLSLGISAKLAVPPLFD